MAYLWRATSGSIATMLDHRACVDALIERMGPDLPADRLLAVFEAAFNAIWRRAGVTLGNVTLTAIVNRVLYSATEQFPALSALRLGSDGIDCHELAGRLDRLERQPLAEGLHFMVVELLTVIGSLTAEILTPALHAALATVTVAEGCVETGDSILTGDSIVREQTNET